MEYFSSSSCLFCYHWGPEGQWPPDPLQTSTLTVTFSEPCSHSFQDESFKKIINKKKFLTDQSFSCSWTCDRLSALLVCHCMMGQRGKQMKSLEVTCVWIFSKSFSVFCAGFLIYIITGSCRGRAGGSLEESGVEDSSWVSSCWVSLCRNTLNFHGAVALSTSQSL